MKRINLIYGGQAYSIADVDLADLQTDITTGLTRNAPFWLVVNYGEGVKREAHLLITPGTDLALIPIPTPSPDPDTTTDAPPPPPAR